jgi:hypothetical protein
MCYINKAQDFDSAGEYYKFFVLGNFDNLNNSQLISEISWQIISSIFLVL